jgi:mannose-6-phosphate isomerase-like protein (cupin superfamily)
MADYTAKKIDEMDAGFGGAFKRVRAELGVESFGVQVLDLPPNLEQFPEHDHSASGQEEVYVAMRGTGWIEVDGERVDIDPDTVVRVGPQATRKIFTGPEGMRILALGGVPGKVYEPPEASRIGAKNPSASTLGARDRRAAGG